MNSLISSLFKTAKKNHDLKMMESLYNGNKNDLLIKLEYAKLLIINRRLDEAKALLIELLDTRNSSYAMLELGKMAVYDKDYITARYYFEKLRDMGDDYGTFEIGRLEYNDGNIKKAREIFLSLLGTKNKGIRIELGRLEASDGNIDLARKYFRDIVTKENDKIGILEEGRLEAGLGNFAEAKKLFTSLLNTEYHYSALIELGIIEAEFNNFDKAEELFLQVKRTPVKRFAYPLLSLLYVKKNDYLKAYYIIKEALEEGLEVNTNVLLDVSSRLHVIFNVNYEELKYTYSLDQQLEYDEYLGLDHVLVRHGIHPNRDFNENIDVYKLYNDIKDRLDESTKITAFNYNDVYVVEYPNVGSHGQNYVKVVTLPGTKDLITMYPQYNKYEYARGLDIKPNSK